LGWTLCILLGTPDGDVCLVGKKLRNPSGCPVGLSTGTLIGFILVGIMVLGSVIIGVAGSTGNVAG
jgi:hypothetical protein